MPKHTTCMICVIIKFIILICLDGETTLYHGHISKNKLIKELKNNKYITSQLCQEYNDNIKGIILLGILIVTVC